MSQAQQPKYKLVMLPPKRENSIPALLFLFLL
jgi:hypothetical protein